MKQVMQNYKTGVLTVEDVPLPSIRDTEVLVQNGFSLISVGTERGKVTAARSTLLGKALQRPDLVKQVMVNVKQEGLIPTIEKVANRLDAPTTLGYCSAGIVLRVGSKTRGLQPGDWVACAGEGFACHSEVVSVPRNLCARVPRGVGLDTAAFAPLGAIALQGIRQSEIVIGERVAVVGLGLVGLLASQILNAAGCQVIGIDVDPDKLALAEELGAALVLHRDASVEKAIYQFTNGYGLDAVLLTASTSSNDPIELAGRLSREKGRVIVIGAVPVNLPRKEYYEKELRVVISRAFGPGSYDANFIHHGCDYPFGYVRWTAQRNMEAFLDLAATGRVKTDRLITHRFSVDQAQSAYELIVEPKGRVLGVLFEYDSVEVPQILHAHQKTKKSNAPVSRDSFASSRPIHIGFIGAGNFAQQYLIPNFKKQGCVLKGVATARSVSAAEVARKFGFEYATCDYNDILNDETTDCIIIATRHDLHASLTVEALRRGKAVFVEKPVATNSNQLEDLIREYSEAEGAITRSGVERSDSDRPRLMVGFNRRFSPFSVAARSLFRDRVGPLVMTYRINAGAVPADHWVKDPVQGGGRVIGEVCHFIDLMIYVTGAKPCSVHAVAAREIGTGASDENLHATIGFDDGSVGSITYTAVGTPTFSRERFEMFGDGKVAVIDNFRVGEYWSTKGRRKISRWIRDMGYRDEITEFVRALRIRDLMPIPFEDLVQGMQATFRVQETMQHATCAKADFETGVAVQST